MLSAFQPLLTLIVTKTQGKKYESQCPFYRCGDRGLQKSSPDLGQSLAYVVIPGPPEHKAIYKVAFREHCPPSRVIPLSEWWSPSHCDAGDRGGLW